MQGNKSTTRAIPMTTTAALISASGQWKERRITNNGASVVYIGKSDVTAANGYPLAVGGYIRDEFSLDAWYGVTSAGTSDIRVLEVG